MKNISWFSVAKFVVFTQLITVCLPRSFKSSLKSFYPLKSSFTSSMTIHSLIQRSQSSCPVVPCIHRQLKSKLYSSSDESLLDEMRKALGDKEDIFDESEKESKKLLQGLRDMDRDPLVKINNKFLEWLDSNGVWVKSSSAWGRAPHPVVISSNTEDDGESCGRGLLAKETMTEGELIMTVPLDICLTRLVAQELLGKAAIPDYLDEYIAIAILLMSEKLKGSESRWKPYIDVLPSVQDVYPSFMWTDEELDLLKGSPSYFASKSLKMKLEREYEEVKTNIFQKLSSQFNPEKYTLDLFIWAFTMLLSRAARLTSKSGGEELALVPYADLMNHSPYSNTYIDAQRSGLPLLSRTEEVALYADRSYKKFEQVFISYGEKSNADLLLLYGFALEKNPFNSVDISVGLSKNDPLYNQKKSYLDRAGRGASSVRFPLQQDRYPSELVDFLRLLLVEPEDLGLQTLDSVDFNEPISPSLERRVLTTMINICESYLDQYPTTADQDDMLIRDRGMFGALSRQQRMAVKLRVSEKRILQQTIQAIQEELNRLPAIVVGDKIIPAGRSFDTMMSSKTKVIQGNDARAWVDVRGPAPSPQPAVPTATVVSATTTSQSKASEASPSPEPAKLSIAERRRRRRSND